MAENGASSPTRKRKQTIMSQSAPEICKTPEEIEIVDEANGEVPVFDIGDTAIGQDDVFTDEPEEPKEILTEKAIVEALNDTNATVNKPNDVSDIVYDDTKPKRLSHPKILKLDLDVPKSRALHESINVLISPDESGSPTRRKRKPIHSVKSEPVINTNQTLDDDADSRLRRETVPENQINQSPSKRSHYVQSPEAARRKVSSPVQRLMAKNSSLAAAAAANSKERKSSSEARLTDNDRSFGISRIPPRRKISSDARLEHRYIDGQLSPGTKPAPKRKVSFDTSALVNGSRMMPLNDQLVVKEEPDHIPEEEVEPKVCVKEFKPEVYDSPRLNIPKVILTTDANESFEQSDDDFETQGETNSDFSDDGEVQFTNGIDNKGYVPDTDGVIIPKENLSLNSSYSANGTRIRRLSPMSDPSFKFNEAAVIPHTNIQSGQSRVNKKVSSSSLPTNIGRQRSATDELSPPKSILKRREDAESINSEESLAMKNFKVRKDSLALFMDQHGTVAMQELRKEYSNGYSCFGKSHIKQLWGNRSMFLEKYKLHLLVLMLFLLTFAFVIVGLHFHDEHHKKLATAQKVFFDAKPRILSLSDLQNKDTLTGKLGLGIPSWKMPIHCSPYYKKIMDKECLKWKEHGQLDIKHFVQNNTQCYNISWNLQPGTSAHDCYNIGGSMWYGPLNMTTSEWPIKSKNFSFTVGKSKHHGSGTFASVVEYYWLSSRGEAVVIDSNYALEINWNEKRPGSLCVISKTAADFYHETKSKEMKFNYVVCNGPDIQTTHALIRKKYYPAVSNLPNRQFLENPHWSTVADSDNFRLNETVVRNVAQSIMENELNCNTMEIDGQWENKFGDLAFDKETFNNMTDLTSHIYKAKCEISLNIYPFFSFHSSNFLEGMNREYFVKDVGGTVPALVKWEQGVGAMLDVSNPAAREWYASKIRNIASEYNIDTFRLAYGSSSWVPKNPVFHIEDISPTKVKLLFSDLISSLGNVVVESTSQSQHISALIGIESSVIAKEDRNCLRNIIPDILNLGLMGYPFILSDGFVIDKKFNGGDFIMPSRDLFIRWMQLSSFLSAVKYTVKPWAYDIEVVEASKNLTRFHSEIVLATIFDAKDKILRGDPLVQPLWWNRAGDKSVYGIDDQFVLADKYLVAPILCEHHINADGAERDIYVPSGVWRDVNYDKVVIGPRWLKKYKATQFHIPYFEKMPEFHD